MDCSRDSQAEVRVEVCVSNVGFYLLGLDDRVR